MPRPCHRPSCLNDFERTFFQTPIYSLAWPLTEPLWGAPVSANRLRAFGLRRIEAEKGPRVEVEGCVGSVLAVDSGATSEGKGTSAAADSRREACPKTRDGVISSSRLG
mmetsp:Transcript_15730/g.36923  ORF Transcript_15730/g.36923 Transcript_15730/m.36923 type:complete len:109 (+) Transcript_15730:349-675(+)